MSRRRQSFNPLGSTLWIGGWLFSIGYLGLGFWPGVLGIVIWPYLMGSALAGF